MKLYPAVRRHSVSSTDDSLSVSTGNGYLNTSVSSANLLSPSMSRSQSITWLEIERLEKRRGSTGSVFSDGDPRWLFLLLEVILMNKYPAFFLQQLNLQRNRTQLPSLGWKCFDMKHNTVVLVLLRGQNLRRHITCRIFWDIFYSKLQARSIWYVWPHIFNCATCLAWTDTPKSW